MRAWRANKPGRVWALITSLHPGPQRIGLFPKIAGAMVLAATIPLLVALIATTGILKDRQEHNAKDALVQLNLQVGDEVSRAIQTDQTALASLAATNILSDRTVPTIEKRALLISFQRSLPNIGGLFLLDKKGDLLASTGPVDLDALKGSEVVANARDGQAAFAKLDVATGQETASFIHGVPLSDAGGQWGVLVAAPVQPEVVGRIMRETRIGQEGYSFLVSGDGTVVAHRHPSKLLQQWREGISLIGEEPSGGGWVAQDGRQWLCVYQQFSISKKLGAPWKAVSCQPDNEVFADLASSQRVLLWAVLGSLGLALLAGFILSRALTKPITSLAASARVIQEGELGHRAEVTSRDEVGDLARSFNEMADSLAQKIEETQRERTTLAAIQASMAEGLVVLDGKEGRVVAINNAAEALLQSPPGKASGQAAEGLLRSGLTDLGPPEAAGEFLAYVLGSSETIKVFHLARSSPPALHVEATVFPIQFGGVDRLTGIIFRDVTQERELERRRNTFVSVASHELRTPLTNMMGYAELLLNRDPSPQRRKQWLQQIHEGSRKLAVIVEDLLNLSRIQSGKLPMRKEQIALDPLLRTALTGVETITEQHEFALEIEPGIPDVVADRDKVVQVLTNLLDNAVKYSPKGGRITLAARRDPTQSRVILSVSDEGLGIAPEDQEKLFNTFQRIKRPETEDIRGSGLGLYIVKELLTMMGGNIWVTSRMNHGSTFFVALPMAESTRTAAPK